MNLRSISAIEDLYGWFRQLLTSVCTSPSSIWLPLCECVLSLKRTLREFFQILLGFLNCFIHSSNYWVFKNAYFQPFFVRTMHRKKNVKTYFYVKKSWLFEKNITFPIAMQESTQNRKLTLKMCFWGSSATSIINFIFFFLKSWDLFLHKTCNFQIGIRKGSQWFFFIIRTDANLCQKLLRRFYYMTLYRKHTVNTTKNWNLNWNYASIMQGAAQALHWNNNQAILFPLVIWGSFTVKLEAGGARLRQSCLLTHR